MTVSLRQRSIIRLLLFVYYRLSGPVFGNGHRILVFLIYTDSSISRLPSSRVADRILNSWLHSRSDSPQAHQYSPSTGFILASVVFGVGEVATAWIGRHRLWFGTAFGLSFALVGLVARLLFPTVYPASGLKSNDVVASPLALNLTTVLCLPVLALCCSTSNPCTAPSQDKLAARDTARELSGRSGSRRFECCCAENRTTTTHQ